MAPALSPEGDRVIYTRLERQGAGRLWISAVSGGAPVQLTSDASASEFPGSWSADGAWFAYLAIRNGEQHLLKVKTTGQAAPVRWIKAAATRCLPGLHPASGSSAAII